MYFLNNNKFKYKQHNIGSVEIYTEQGKVKCYTPYGICYYYNYKSFDIWLWNNPEKNEDIEVYIAEINQLEKIIEDKKTRGREAMELLKKTYNLDERGVRDLIKYLK